MLEEELEKIEIFLAELFWTDVIIALAIILFFLMIKSIFARFISRLVTRLTGKTPTSLDTEIWEAFCHPLESFCVFLGVFLALIYLPVPGSIQEIITSLFRVIIIILVAQGSYRFLHADSVIFKELGDKLNLESDAVLVNFLSKISRFVLIALIISVITEEFGFNVGQFVAGLGIGGLAVALAAQETLMNFFGGLMIIIDKPFTVGDWIATPSVEGVVEEVSFRYTRVRTFPKSLVTVPNSTLGREAITNWSRMGKRQVRHHLGVTYTTPREKLQNCVEKIRLLLDNHPEVDQERKMVYFENFGDSSLDIFIYYFTVPTEWAEHLRVKEDVNFNLMKILEEEGVSVAFPSRSIYFENSLQGDFNVGEGSK